MKIMNKQTVAETKFLNLNMTQYEDKKGDLQQWVWAERPNGQHAVVIAAKVGNKILMIKEFRVPIEDYEWGFPAGLIELNEDVEKAVARELKEETGLDFGKLIRPISPLIYNTAGMTNEGSYMAFVEAKGTITDEYTEASEDIVAALFSKDEIKKMLEDTDKKFGAKAYLILQRFADHGDI